MIFTTKIVNIYYYTFQFFKIIFVVILLIKEGVFASSQ